MKRSLILLLMASPCFAGPSVTILGGGAFPLSDIEIEGAGSDKIGSSGGAFGVQVMVPVTDQLSVGGDFLASDLGAKTSDALITGLHSDYHLHANTFLVGAKLASKRDKIEPFLFGGLGIHSTSMVADLSPMPGLAWADTGTTEARRVIDDSATGFAMALALGLDYYVTPSLSLGAEARYEYLAKTDFETVPISGAGTATIQGNTSAIALLIRAAVHF
jgi:opacity protein-like surface antigen